MAARADRGSSPPEKHQTKTEHSTEQLSAVLDLKLFCAVCWMSFGSLRCCPNHIVNPLGASAGQLGLFLEGWKNHCKTGAAENSKSCGGCPVVP